MITLTLLHPLKNVPVQSWTFEQEKLIRIGRATDNQVVLYSAVVSRNHVEIRLNGHQWEVVSLGTNGTYIDGKRISQVPLVDGLTMRLARSGPNIQVRLGPQGMKDVLALSEELTIGQRAEPKSPDLNAQSSKDAKKDLNPSETVIPGSDLEATAE